jgi:[acyl-carrier-protein] S-malonyltransferase
MKVAFIFPAFVSEYIGNEVQILNALSNNFQENLKKASVASGVDFEPFHLEDSAFTEDELRVQIISYIFSCSLSDELIARGIKPDILAGYSMGLYAALYTGSVIEFDEGIRLIIQAFNISQSAIQGMDAGMGSIIGLTKEEINGIILKHKLEAEIANTNSAHSHLVTGRSEPLNRLLELARTTGALHVSMLNVNTPYHASMLKSTSGPFNEFITAHIRLRKSKYPIISSIDQRLMESPEDFQKELTENLSGRINWMTSFESILQLGVKQFIECGAGNSLKKISRFQSGDFKVYPMNKVEKLLK